MESAFSFQFFYLHNFYVTLHLKTLLDAQLRPSFTLGKKWNSKNERTKERKQKTP